MPLFQNIKCLFSEISVLNVKCFCNGDNLVAFPWESSMGIEFTQYFSTFTNSHLINYFDERCRLPPFFNYYFTTKAFFPEYYFQKLSMKPRNKVAMSVMIAVYIFSTVFIGLLEFLKVFILITTFSKILFYKHIFLIGCNSLIWCQARPFMYWIWNTLWVEHSFLPNFKDFSSLKNLQLISLTKSKIIFTLFSKRVHLTPHTIFDLNPNDKQTWNILISSILLSWLDNRHKIY